MLKLFSAKIGIAVATLLASLVFTTETIFAQQRCSAMEYEALRASKNKTPSKGPEFEHWLQNKIAEHKKARFTYKTLTPILEIPVVVHIIHNGEALGVGSNIPDAQVVSQIEALNEDFRRLNADANETLAQFLSVADDMEINFILAKQDPEGLPTTGIVRAQGDQSNYGLTEAAKLSAVSYWPAEDYMNIWVANLSSNLLGYAQFPVSSLEGLEDATNNRLTDGVVMRYQSFGAASKGNFPALIAPFHEGRTTTHEVGHFLGLRHIWGDGNCNVDDFCDDTPTSSSEHEGCNLSRESCGQLSMVQNFMDYTDDVCMNLFTTDQKTRMRTVLENSPRRKSLLDSQGGTDPIQVANDLGIREIITPQQGLCSTDITPEITIRNYGTNNITSAVVEVTQNGQVIETLNLSVNLAPLEIETVTFSPLAGLDPNTYEFTFAIIETNSGSDNNLLNDTKSLVTAVNFSTTTSINESFSIQPDNWLIANPDQATTWSIATAPGASGSTNMAIGMQNFSYTDGFGEVDRLLTPVFDMSQSLSGSLSFKYAYANNPNGNFDRLTVSISTDCGNSFSNIVFDEFGDNLATADASSNSFVPVDKFSWRTVNVNLNNFLGSEEVQIAFENQNGNGNNLYLDDVEVTIENQLGNDLSISSIIQPSFIVCDGNVSPQILVKNNGSETISSFEAQLFKGNLQQTIQVNTNLSPFQTMLVEFDPVTVDEGSNVYNFQIGNPNDQPDQNPIDNSRSIDGFSNNQVELLPLRQQFANQNFEDDNWVTYNPDNGIGWEITSTNSDSNGTGSALINGYNYINSGEEDWLISPMLDLSSATAASMTFKRSYAEVDNFTDRLKIMVSTNCGASFDNIIFSKSGSSLATTATNEDWIPVNPGDWADEFVDLTFYAGEPEVRIAFVFENQFGNNLYLDDIEFYLTNNLDFPIPALNSVIMFPNPSTESFVNLTFNLAQKADINVVITSSQGKLVYEKLLTNTLNQTYSLEFPQLSDGLYFMKIVGGGVDQTKKLLFQR